MSCKRTAGCVAPLWQEHGENDLGDKDNAPYSV